MECSVIWQFSKVFELPPNGTFWTNRTNLCVYLKVLQPSKLYKRTLWFLWEMTQKKREPHLHSKYRPQILTGNFSSSYFKYGSGAASDWPKLISHRKANQIGNFKEVKLEK